MEKLILHELWDWREAGLGEGRSAVSETRASISVSAVPCGPGTDIWRSCRFVEPFAGHCVLCLPVLVGSCLAILVLITAGFGT